jgi:UDP-glucose 4-epimerase
MSRVVLVTGGAGYIGSHVCKALAEAGHQPICFDTLEKGHDWAVRWGPLERGDIGDAVRLDDVLSRHRASAVIHLAGYIEVGESVNQPERYLHNNAAKSDILIEAALRHGVDALVFSSSCAVYGLPQTDLLAESHRIAPISPYAESKARVERALAAVAACGRRRCAISMPPAPMPRARSARRTIPRPICCRSPPTPFSASAPPSPCWARTTRRPTVRASATSCM